MLRSFSSKYREEEFAVMCLGKVSPIVRDVGFSLGFGILKQKGRWGGGGWVAGEETWD